MNFLKMAPSRLVVALAQDFSQEQDFPEKNLLPRCSRTPETGAAALKSAISALLINHCYAKDLVPDLTEKAPDLDPHHCHMSI
jgi:hypothetical protein